MSEDLDAIFRFILQAEGHERRDAVGVYADALEAAGDDAGAWMFRQENCPLGVTPEQLREFSRSRMVMQRIRAGEFLMGSPDHDAHANDDEKPRHKARLAKDFQLGVFPVTQDQYRRVIKAYGSAAEGGSPTPSRFSGNPDHPVETVTWWDAVHFCNMLSRMETLRPYYEIVNDTVQRNAFADGYRLPTEAEWEFACRAGSTTIWPWGDTEADLGDYAWYRAISELTTRPAGEKRPNAWGLYDTLGNVREWCDDNLGEKSLDLNAEGFSYKSGSGRVNRGGGWYNFPQSVRPACRHWADANHRGLDLGFRIAGTCT